MIDTVDPGGGGGSTIDIEAIDTEVINTVDPGGGSTIDVEVIDAEANGIVGIARCIMGNPFSSTSELQVPWFPHFWTDKFP